MATVTGIEIERGMVGVYVDGTLTQRLRKAHFIKCPLQEGDEVDVERWIDRVAAAQFDDAWEAALNSLDVCARTERELRRSLARRGYVEPAVDAVMERLREVGLIDDARYAERMAELQSRKPVGVYAFKRKLMAKGVSEDAAAQALEAFDDEQQQAACLEAAKKLWRKYEALPPREGRAKLSQALARRGFGWESIESAIDQLCD
ncbi:MAG: regulatory protein RecX [Clostridia bacterium]|nr:regulatory protein RecX [Clostridia bacterium]